MIQRRHLILLSLAGAIVSFDQFTKRIVLGQLRVGESSEVIPHFFDITLINNPGAAFGLLAQVEPSIRDPFLALIPVVTLVAILFIFQKLQDSQRLSVVALSSIVGGAVGNLIDRARIGYVTDFLDFHWKDRYHFPAFNLADIAITIGVFMLVLTMLLERDGATKK